MVARRAYRLWHKWFGIIAGGWLLLLAVTGVAIAWYDELDTTLNPHLRLAAAVAGEPASLDRVVANAERVLPGWQLGNLLLAPSKEASHWLIGRQSLPGGGGRAMHVFVDPVTAGVLGWREAGALSLHRHHLPDLVYGLHTDLLAGEIGVWLVGIVGILWLVDHFLALPLAFPARERWHEAFSMKGRRGSLRRLFDWHRAKGMWLWLAGATLALTGVTLTFPVASRDVVGQLSPVGGRLHEGMEHREPVSQPIGLERAARAVTPNAEALHSIRPFPELGLYAVRTYDPRDNDDQGRLWNYVRMEDGVIVARRHDTGSTPGDIFFAWQYPLHSGRAFGLAGQIVVSIAGLVTALLCYSGWRLWLRRRSNNVRSSKQPWGSSDGSAKGIDPVAAGPADR